MAATTFTFRTDEKLKNEASKLYDSLGLNLSVAINMFLKQSVIKKKFPCSLELEVAKDYANTYPEEFFSLFGSLKDFDLEEPKELSFKYDKREEL